MSEKKKIVSFSVEPRKHSLLKTAADKKTDGNVSQLLCDMIDKYIVADGDVTPVILKVPNALKADRDALQKWLESRSAAILEALAK